ncbi:hypothetical protein CLOP_g6647 [Closterium sp. NIES-67]|nr:hypothetical protein CLOP_g6647 [Closterium sp. NIES-67]
MAPGATRSSSRRSLLSASGGASGGASARGVASDAAADAAAQEATSRPSKEWRMLPLGYRPAHAVALQERIEEMWEARAGREGGGGEGAGEGSGREGRGRGSEGECEGGGAARVGGAKLGVQSAAGVVLEIPSDARLSDALRLLQKSGLMAAPVRDVAAREDAPLQQRYLGMVDGAGIVLWVMGQLDRSSAELRMAAAAGGGLAGLAVAGLGAAALGAPDAAALAAMWAGSMAGGLLGSKSAEAPGEGEAGGGVERVRVSAGGLDRLLQRNVFQTTMVSWCLNWWGPSAGAHSSPSPRPTQSSLSCCWLAMPHRPQVLPIVTYPPPPPLPSLLSFSSSPFSSPSASSPASSSPSSPTPSSLLSSSPSSSPPSSSSATFPASTSAEPAAAASSLGSETAPVPSLSALVSQADVVNFLAECDGQPWFEWVAGRRLSDMGLPRMDKESTVKVQESDPVMEPFRLMLQHDIGGVPVVAPGTNRITANISARDILQLLTSPHLAEQHHLKR